MARRRVAVACISPTVEEEPTAGMFSYGARAVVAALASPPRPGVETHLVEVGAADADALDAGIARLDPDILGLSTYVWSLPTLLEVARRARRRRPDLLVVAGGPSARPAVFDLPPHRDAARDVDALVLAEGEEVMREIAALPDLDRARLAGIGGMAVPEGDGWRSTGPRAPAAMDDLPSPHTLGLVPPGSTTHLETFRGCPFTCSFCEWGVLGHRREGRSQAYLERELAAIAGMAPQEVFLVDAGLNLNRRALTNLVAAEEAVGLFRDTPLSCEVYATHLRDEELGLLARAKPGRIGVGLQSFNPAALALMGRPFDEARFLEGMRRLADVAPTTVEIILGLPGDDPDGFRRTLERALALPCERVHVFHCLALPDGLMTRAPEGSDIDFDPATLKVRSCRGWSRDALEAMGAEVARLALERGGPVHPDACEIPAGPLG